MATIDPTSDVSILQLKVTLLGVEPSVWRRLLVPASITLTELHFVINEALGWSCAQLHTFTEGARKFGDPELDPDNAHQYEDENEVTLESLVKVGQKLTYAYDLSDEWEHEILVEQRVALDPRTAYPLCIGGARACPPEDCEGPEGYKLFLAAMGDPSHPEHDQMREWIGGYFDPEGFDANRTNLAIRHMYECPDCEGCDDESCDCDHKGHSHSHDHDN